MKRWLVLLLTMVLLTLNLAACGGGGTEQAAVPPADETKAQQDKASVNSLDELLAKAGQAKELSFEMITTMSGDQPISSTSKMFISGEKARMEMDAMGVQMITIIDDEGNAYIYDPLNNNAMKMPASQEEIDSPGDWTEGTSDIEVIGEETIDGLDCLVAMGISEGMETKIWVRKDIGMPARVEIEEKQAVIEYKNYKIGPQDPALFQIPADAVITELPGTP